MAEKPEIKVTRRRRTSTPTSQAAAPVRRQTPGQTSRPVSSSTPGYSSSSTSGGSFLGTSGGGLLKGTTGKLGCGGIILVLVLVVIFVLMNKCSGGGLPLDDIYATEEPTSIQQPITVRPTKTTKPSLSLPVTTSDQKWLVMVYQDADDQALEQDIFVDFNEMERIGSTDQVMIVSQMDRFRGGFAGNSDFSTARRYLVTYDEDLNTIGSDLIEDLGEVNMADGDTLVDFVTWAVDAYPANHYVLILSDHGLGWPGGWTDPSPASVDGGSAPLISKLPTDSIYLSELDDALARIQANTGIGKFDLIGLDACLMSQMEVYMMLEPYAHTAVASEETEPGLGWAYSAFLSMLVYDPSIDATQLAANIVESYIDQDERVTDDAARAEFLRQNSSTGGFFGTMRISADQLASQLEQNITLTAVNLDKIGQVNDGLNALAYEMQSVNQQAVASARNYAQSYTNIFGSQVPPSYIDLGHFAALVYKQTGNSAIRTAAQNLLNSMQDAIIAERHGQTKPGSTGIAIYFPNSTLFRNQATGMQSYTTLANRFSKVSLWDDFLVFHYTERNFDANDMVSVVPSASTPVRGPGSGLIAISPITTSSTTVKPGGSVTLSADITGDNIGYIYFFTGLFDPDSNSILVADTDYLESSQTEELGGVYYPQWPDSEIFRMSFDWEPIVFTISDGQQSELALFNPIAYGANPDQAVYAVRGTYTFNQTGEQRKADLLFMNEKLFQVYGYYGSDTAGAPSEIAPALGDTFTISHKWLELDSSGNITRVVYEDGETITFGQSPFVWETLDAPDGTYLVGFQVSDLDGNLGQAYTQITVQ